MDSHAESQFLTLFTRVCSPSSKMQWIVGNISFYRPHFENPPEIVDHAVTSLPLLYVCLLLLLCVWLIGVPKWAGKSLKKSNFQFLNLIIK